MKKLIIALMVCAAANCAMAAADASAKAVKAAKPQTAVKLSDARIAYAVEYDALKSGLLGKDGDKMGDVEALQAVAVHFSRAFRRTEERIADLERRAQSLENDVAALKSWANAAEDRIKEQGRRIEECEQNIKAHDGDLSKLFKWANDTDDEMHDEPRVGGSICGNIASVKAQIGKMSERIGSDEKAIDNHAAAIRDLYNAINALRFR